MAIVSGLLFGAIVFSTSDVVSALQNREEAHSLILFNVRLPRILVAALAGACLAASGAILQGVMKNPLADPSIIGVTAGAGLAATIAW